MTDVLMSHEIPLSKESHFAASLRGINYCRRLWKETSWVDVLILSFTEDLKCVGNGHAYKTKNKSQIVMTRHDRKLRAHHYTESDHRLYE